MWLNLLRKQLGGGDNFSSITLFTLLFLLFNPREIIRKNCKDRRIVSPNRLNQCPSWRLHRRHHRIVMSAVDDCEQAWFTHRLYWKVFQAEIPIPRDIPTPTNWLYVVLNRINDKRTSIVAWFDIISKADQHCRENHQFCCFDGDPKLSSIGQ